MRKLLLGSAYLAAIIIGVLMLVFNHQAATPDEQGVLRGLIIAAGIIFIIPGLVQMVASVRPRHDDAGAPLPQKWYTVAIAAFCLIWGIILLIFTGSMCQMPAITFGVSLIVAGAASFFWILRDSRRYISHISWYIIPLLTVVMGIVDLAVISNSALTHNNIVACIASGAFLIALGVNRFITLKRKRRTDIKYSGEAKKLKV